MIEFKGFGEFANFLRRLEPAVVSAGYRGVKDAVDIIRDQAKEEIGQYQTAAGPFPDWQQLSEATLYGFHHPLAGYIPGKIEAGYATEAEHRPLERDGDLRESYQSSANGNEGAAGSNDDMAIWQELGTPNALYPIPPRSILGLAAVVKGEQAAKAIASHVVEALAGLGPRNRPKEFG